MSILNSYIMIILLNIIMKHVHFLSNSQITQLLKKADVLHMKKLISNEDDIDDRHFLNTYDDYFS